MRNVKMLLTGIRTANVTFWFDRRNNQKYIRRNHSFNRQRIVLSHLISSAHSLVQIASYAAREIGDPKRTLTV